MKYAEIKTKLAEPIPEDKLSKKPVGRPDDRQEVAYVKVTICKDLLDERAGVWEALVLDYKQIGQSLCCAVRIRIHADDGIFEQDGTGIEQLALSGYGDPLSNAYAQAFRRACENHGLCRELWRSSAMLDASGPAAFQIVGRRPPIESGIGQSATDKQIGKIKALGRELKMNVADDVVELYKCQLEDLSKRRASDFIDHLTALRPKRQAA